MPFFEEQKRLVAWVKYLPKALVCSNKEHPPSFLHPRTKVVTVHQVYSNKNKITKKGKAKQTVKEEEEEEKEKEEKVKSKSRKRKQQSTREEKEKTEEETIEAQDACEHYTLVFKSGFFWDLSGMSGRTSLRLQSVQVAFSFFYLEQAALTKDHMLHLLTFLTCTLKRGGYFIGTVFDAMQVLSIFAQEMESQCVKIPRGTFEKCQLNLLDGLNNASILASLKIPLGCEFQLNLSHPEILDQDKSWLPSRLVLFDWENMHKLIGRFGFRLVETRLFSPLEGLPQLCRSFVFQQVENRLFR